jgi:hypothetical protein
MWHTTKNLTHLSSSYTHWNLRHTISGNVHSAGQNCHVTTLTTTFDLKTCDVGSCKRSNIKSSLLFAVWHALISWSLCNVAGISKTPDAAHVNLDLRQILRFMWKLLFWELWVFLSKQIQVYLLTSPCENARRNLQDPKSCALLHHVDCSWWRVAGPQNLTIRQQRRKNFTLPTLQLVGGDSEVGTAIRYELESTRIETQWRKDFQHMSRPARGHTHPPTQWMPDPCLGGKAAGAWR